MKNYLQKHRKPFGILGACAAFAVAVIYLIVVPEEAQATNGVRKLVLLYAHSGCWFLLSAASLTWSLGRSKKLSIIFAYSALAMYACFMAVLLTVKFT